MIFKFRGGGFSIRGKGLYIYMYIYIDTYIRYCIFDEPCPAKGPSNPLKLNPLTL